MKLDILAFGAHPDDVEISAAGTLLKHVERGFKAGVVDLTQGELGTRGTIETRYHEAADAAKIMGLSTRVNLKLADGFFQHDAESRILIIEQIRRFRPEIVLVNAPHDRHPDHGRASQLVSEACYYSGLRKIETTWEGELQEAYRPKVVYKYIQDYFINPDFVVDVTPFAEQKMEAILAYKTQFYDPNSTEPKTPISGKEFIDFLKARMMHFGRPSGALYAEGFLVERIPAVDLLTDLK